MELSLDPLNDGLKGGIHRILQSLKITKNGFRGRRENLGKKWVTSRLREPAFQPPGHPNVWRLPQGHGEHHAP